MLHLCRFKREQAFVLWAHLHKASKVRSRECSINLWLQYGMQNDCEWHFYAPALVPSRKLAGKHKSIRWILDCSHRLCVVASINKNDYILHISCHHSWSGAGKIEDHNPIFNPYPQPYIVEYLGSGYHGLTFDPLEARQHWVPNATMQQTTGT